MLRESRTQNQGTDRRTFLKTIGITAGIASYGSTMSTAEGRSPDGKRHEWVGPRSGPGRTGATDDDGPTPYAALDWKMDLDGSM